MPSIEPSLWTRVVSCLNRGFVVLILAVICLSYSVQAKAVQKKWTVLFYIAGDEPEIDPYSRVPIRKLEQLTADNDRNIVAQTELWWDDSGTNHVEAPARRYFITPNPGPIDGKNFDTLQIQSPIVWESAVKLNSAYAPNIADFLSWAKTNYPAEHYALFLLGHGWGWKGLLEDDDPGVLPPFPGGTPPAYVLASLGEVRNAISTAFGPRNRLDLLVMDLCDMGVLESAYAMRGLTKYYIATPGEMPWLSFDYTRSFQDFSDAGQPSVEVLARNLVSQSLVSFSRGGSQAPMESGYPPLSLFALDMQKLEKLWSPWRSLARSLEGTNFATLFLGSREDRWGDEDSHVDWVDLLSELKSRSDSSEVKNRAAQILKLLGEPNPNPAIDSEFFQMIPGSGVSAVRLVVQGDEYLSKSDVKDYFEGSFNYLNPAFAGLKLKLKIDDRSTGRVVSLQWDWPDKTKTLKIRPFLPGATWAKLELLDQKAKVVQSHEWKSPVTYAVRTEFPSTSPYLITGHTFGAGRYNGLSLFVDSTLDPTYPENIHWTGTEWISGEAYYRTIGFCESFKWGDLLFGRAGTQVPPALR